MASKNSMSVFTKSYYKIKVEVEESVHYHSEAAGSWDKVDAHFL